MIEWPGIAVPVAPVTLDPPELSVLVISRFVSGVSVRTSSDSALTLAASYRAMVPPPVGKAKLVTKMFPADTATPCGE